MVPSGIGIIIPAFNEVHSVAEIVSEASTYGQVILIDDGSDDGTGRIAEENGAIVVLHEKNRGYDAALNSGFAKASEIGCEAVVTIDADGQHKPQLISEFIKYIKEGYDVVIGIRNRKQRFAEHIFAWYTKRKYGIIDPLCGMKAYRMKVYDKLGYFDSYDSIGTELAVFSAINGYKLAQHSFNVLSRKGNPKFGKSILGNYKILRALLIILYTCKEINT